MSHFDDNHYDDYELSFSDEQKAKVKSEAAELEDELVSMKKRERYYLGILAGVMLVAGIASFHILRGNSLANTFAYDNGNYNAQAGLTPVSISGGAGAAAGGGCGSSGGGGGGGCCGGGSGQQAPVDTAAIAEAGKVFYLQQTGTKEQVETKVTDYGCHIQCDVLSGGQVIKSYSYRNNTFVEI